MTQLYRYPLSGKVRTVLLQAFYGQSSWAIRTVAKVRFEHRVRILFGQSVPSPYTHWGEFILFDSSSNYRVVVILRPQS